MSETALSQEQLRLREDLGSAAAVGPWRKWGPYVAQRAWATVREDYSADGNAWEYFPHDVARSKAFRWGEDGIAGICDRYQILVFALALWNGKDPILKERMFGLVPGESNHGEDVKECYFYLDSTPTHSYMKFLYKYPQREFPYQKLIENSRGRGKEQGEYELMDTGVFDEERYFDVIVEYAKFDAEDIAIRVEVINRGPEAATIHLLPQLWFRNTWGWGAAGKPQPVIREGAAGKNHVSLEADDRMAEAPTNLPFHYQLGRRILYGDRAPLLFTNNESNAERLWNVASVTPYVKDAFHREIIHAEPCTNPKKSGTKACLHFKHEIAGGGSSVFRLRLAPREIDRPLDGIDELVNRRRAEADEFYQALHPPAATAEEKQIQRQALAGLLWNKQVYLFDVAAWLDGDDASAPPPASRHHRRNQHWRHLNSMRVLSVPDKWEYPWFAAWDTAFQALPLALVDPEFAKEQLWLLLFEQFQHPNGQIPAYEWDFSDINPPVHGWAVWRVYEIERARSGSGDVEFLEKCFHKLLINFAWWVNRVDSQGNNIFEGGFLGLDNITVLDRSAPAGNGDRLEQADATAWMAMFCLNLMRIALELARRRSRAYEALATKFFQHYVYVAAAIKGQSEGADLWDEQDQFFYDVIRRPDGSAQQLRVRSLVGLIPLYASEVLSAAELSEFPSFLSNLEWFANNRSVMARTCVSRLGSGERGWYILCPLDQAQLSAVLRRVWDPQEFRSEHGLRSLSRYHLENPFEMSGQRVGYEPAEAVASLKGGNSNWRGPIWFPTTFLLIESLQRLERAYGESMEIVAADGAAAPATLGALSRYFAERLIGLFKRGRDGMRPADGRHAAMFTHPQWRELRWFHEYFHGDSGSGLGSCHQTGWTALVATLIDQARTAS